MSDITLKLTDNNTIKFEILVDGAPANEMEPRFVISQCDNIDLLFNGVIDGDEDSVDATFDLVMLGRHIKKAGEYQCRLELVLGDRIFVPMEGTCNIKSGIKISAKKKKVIKVAIPNWADSQPMFDTSVPIWDDTEE